MSGAPEAPSVDDKKPNFSGRRMLPTPQNGTVSSDQLKGALQVGSISGGQQGIGNLPLTATTDELLQLILTVDYTSGHSVVDLDFRRAFYLNHPLFYNSEELAARLEHAYSSNNSTSTFGLLAKINVLYILCEWAELFYNDVQPLLNSSNAKVKAFLKTMSTPPAVSTDLVSELKLESSHDKPSHVALNKRLQDEQRHFALLMMKGEKRGEDMLTGKEAKNAAQGQNKEKKPVNLDTFLQNYLQSVSNMPTPAPQQSMRASGFLSNLLSPSTPSPPPTSSNAISSASLFSILNYRSAQLAAQFTLMDITIFATLMPREFIRKEWTRKDTCNEKTPNILAVIELFNRRSYWVACQILYADNAKRDLVLRKLIDVLRECVRQKNYFAAYSLLTGISITPVHRLKALWSSLPSKYNERFRKLSAQLDSGKNFAAYRALFAEGVSGAYPQVPHMVCVLKDLFQFEEIDGVEGGQGGDKKKKDKDGKDNKEKPKDGDNTSAAPAKASTGNPPLPTGAKPPSGSDQPKIINYHKYIKQMRVLSQVIYCQRNALKYQTDLTSLQHGECSRGLVQAMTTIAVDAGTSSGQAGFNEDGLWKASYFIEPRAGDARQKLLDLEKKFTGKRKPPIPLAAPRLKDTRATLATPLTGLAPGDENKDKEQKKDPSQMTKEEREREEEEAENERDLIMEGFLKRGTRRGIKKFYFHLLTDMLLYSEQLTLGGFDLHQCIMLHNCEVQDKPDSGSEKFAIQITSSQKSFVVFAENQNEKMDWFNKLSNCILKLSSQVPEGVTPIAPMWARDTESNECLRCRKKFTLLNRRHHCRSCGVLVCGSCSGQKALLKHIHKTSPQRVCDHCYANPSSATLYRARTNTGHNGEKSAGAGGQDENSQDNNGDSIKGDPSRDFVPGSVMGSPGFDRDSSTLLGPSTFQPESSLAMNITVGSVGGTTSNLNRNSNDVPMNGVFLSRKTPRKPPPLHHPASSSSLLGSSPPGTSSDQGEKRKSNSSGAAPASLLGSGGDSSDDDEPSPIPATVASASPSSTASNSSVSTNGSTSAPTAAPTSTSTSTSTATQPSLPSVNGKAVNASASVPGNDPKPIPGHVRQATAAFGAPPSSSNTTTASTGTTGTGAKPIVPPKPLGLSKEVPGMPKPPETRPAAPTTTAPAKTATTAGTSTAAATTGSPANPPPTPSSSAPKKALGHSSTVPTGATPPPAKTATGHAAPLPPPPRKVP